MLKEIMQERNLPELMRMNDGTPVTSAEQWRKRRTEILEILQENCYGRTPDALPASAEVIRTMDSFCAGKAPHQELAVTLQTPGKPFTFPVHLFVPKKVKKPPVFIHINFRSDVPDRYCPVEEITDSGFAVAMFDYRTVTSDDGDFTNGLAGEYIGNRERRPNEWGKIGMWAYAASRVLDVLTQMDCVDVSKAFVTGHSRLGKTAMWCAAQDERFAMGISNDSGCGGVSIERGKIGEHVDVITKVFPFWFCPHYHDFADDTTKMPFDQHFVPACVAPRVAYIASAEEDSWADPVSEFLSALAVSPAFEITGVKGLVYEDDELPTAPAVFHRGNVAYHVRLGQHYFSREDWKYQMARARLI